MHVSQNNWDVLHSNPAARSIPKQYFAEVLVVLHRRELSLTMPGRAVRDTRNPLGTKG